MNAIPEDIFLILSIVIFIYLSILDINFSIYVGHIPTENSLLSFIVISPILLVNASYFQKFKMRGRI